jgi:hypothetical protein
VRHPLDVEAARSNVRGNHQRPLARHEHFQGLVALRLLLVAVDAARAQAFVPEGLQVLQVLQVLVFVLVLVMG